MDHPGALGSARSTASRGLLALVLVGASIVATSARAENRASARLAYAEGSRFYDIGEYKNALDAFRRAYLAYEDPTFLYNIGQCHRQLGDASNAIQFYRSYLRKMPDPPNRGEVEKLIAGLEARATRPSPPAAPPRAAPEPAPIAAAPAPAPPLVPAPAPIVAAATPAPSPPAAGLAVSEPTPPPRRSRAWIAGAVVPSVVVLGVAIGLMAYYLSPGPAYTKLAGVEVQ